MKYLPHHREFEQLSDRTTNIIAVIMLVLLVWLACWFFVDAIVRTVETEEEQRIYRADTERPKAFRKASPTPEQMDAYHDLMRIQEVRR